MHNFNFGWDPRSARNSKCCTERYRSPQDQTLVQGAAQASSCPNAQFQHNPLPPHIPEQHSALPLHGRLPLMHVHMGCWIVRQHEVRWSGAHDIKEQWLGLTFLKLQLTKCVQKRQAFIISSGVQSRAPFSLQIRRALWKSVSTPTCNLVPASRKEVSVCLELPPKEKVNRTYACFL